MKPILRLDALEAGLSFAQWQVSNDKALEDNVRTFASNLGLQWQSFETLRSKEDGTLNLLKLIEQASKDSEQPYVFSWFQVGLNTFALTSIALTAPAEVLDLAITGYRRYLEDAGIRFEERDRLVDLQHALASDSIEKRGSRFGQLRERLRDQARIQDDEQGRKGRKPNNPWVSGSFYLFVVIVAGAGLLAAAQVLPIIALPLVIIGAILALSIVGALQLKNDERLKDAPFIELMALSLKYLPVFKRRDSKTPSRSG